MAEGAERKETKVQAYDCGNGNVFDIKSWSELYWIVTRSPGCRIYGYLSNIELGKPEMDPEVMICQDWNIQDGNELYIVQQIGQDKFQLNNREFSGSLSPCHSILIPPELSSQSNPQPFFISPDIPHRDHHKLSSPVTVIHTFLSNFHNSVKNSYTADDRKQGNRLAVTPIYIFLTTDGPVFHGEIWSWLMKFTPSTAVNN